MLAAFDAQVALAERRVHEITLVRPIVVGMHEGPEVAAARAHALDRDDAGLLHVANHLDQRDQEILLLQNGWPDAGMTSFSSRGTR